MSESKTTLLIAMLALLSAPALANNAPFICDEVYDSNPPMCAHGHYVDLKAEKKAEDVWDDSMKAAQDRADADRTAQFCFQSPTCLKAVMDKYEKETANGK